MLRNDGDAISWVFRKKEGGRQPDNTSTKALYEYKTGNGSLGLIGGSPQNYNVCFCHNKNGE